MYKFVTEKWGKFKPGTFQISRLAAWMVLQEVTLVTRIMAKVTDLVVAAKRKTIRKNGLSRVVQLKYGDI